MQILKRQFYIIFGLLVLTTIKVVNSQEMIGVTFGNFSSITSAVVNPALMTGSKAYININIFSSDIFVKNNWAYIPKEDKTFWDLITLDTLIPQYGKWKYNGLYTYHQNTNPVNIYQSTRMLGPSFVIQNGAHAFGLSLSLRSQTSATNIAYEIPVFMYETMTYEELQNIVFDDKDFNFSSLTWSELAASWAWDFVRPYKAKLTFGVNLKLNLAHDGAYAVNNHAKYIVYNPKTIQIYNYDAEIAYALPINYDSTNIIIEGPIIQGIGTGIDLGFVYTRMKSSIYSRGGSRNCSKPYEDYIYRIGVSIVDIGAVSFNKNAQKHRFNDVGVYWTQFDTLEYNSFNTSIQALSKALYGDPNQSKTADNFSIPLPTSLSVQFDAHITRNMYLSALVMQPLVFSKRQLLRPVQYAITPRFENDYFALSMPISLSQYKYLRLGTAIRIGPLTVGSERLGTLLGISDLDGMDLYVSLKFSIKKGKCADNKYGACFNSNYGR